MLLHRMVSRWRAPWRRVICHQDDPGPTKPSLDETIALTGLCRLGALQALEDDLRSAVRTLRSLDAGATSL
jgi:hypothetical protein